MLSTNKLIKLYITVLVILFNSKSLLGQIQAFSSIELPLIEIKDEKTNRLIKTIKMDEPVTIINISQDQKYVFAHTPFVIYRVNIATGKFDQLALSLTYVYSSNVKTLNSTAMLSTGSQSNDIEVAKRETQTKVPIKTAYHSNPKYDLEAGFISQVTYLSYNNFSSSKIFFTVDQSFLGSNQSTNIYSVNFENDKIEKVVNISFPSSGIVLKQCYDFTNRQIVYSVDSRGVVNAINLNKGVTNTLFTIDIPEGFENQKFFSILSRSPNELWATFYSNSIELKKSVTLLYDKKNYTKIKEIVREGDQLHVIPILFNEKPVLWRYFKINSVPAPERIPLPNYPKQPEKYNKKAREQHALNIQQYEKQLDSIRHINDTAILKHTNRDQSKNIIFLVFSNEELTDKIFEFAGAQSFELISETRLQVSFSDEKINVYDILTKKLIKSSRKKASSIDDF